MPNRQGAASTRMDRIARMLWLALLLAAAWLLWSGFFKPLLLALGALSCALTVFLSHRLHLFDTDFFSLRFSLRLFRFWGWLARQIVLSSVEVARVVLNPKLPISPTVVDFEAGSAHPVDRAILGNSIILTPGTLTLIIDGRKLTVHCLTRQGAEEIRAGEMNRHVTGLRMR
ncbi:MAG: Na+/H+ antiporter subunit E [Xanthomonadales bacterium]|nr:Na+/H+ antiporter subunit E [Xanthomonadales bacterium]